MGANGSSESEAPFNEHFYGLVNFGNTCYVNSVLQALYFCKPFREKIIQYKINSGSKHSNQNCNNNQTNNNTTTTTTTTNTTTTLSTTNNNNSNGNLETSSNSLNNETITTNGVNATSNTINKSDSKSSNNNNNNNVPITKQEHLLNCLAELFYTIVTMKKKKGIVQPKKFIARLRKDNDAFDNLFQQDAHEFLNYLLNTCADILKAEMKEMKELQLNEEQMRQSESSSLRLSTKFHRTKNNNNNNSNNINNGDSLANDNHNFTHGSNSKNSSNRSINSQNSNSKYSTLESISAKTDKSTSNDDQNKNNINTSNSTEELTWIHELFQGILVNETRCLNCDTSSSKEENFLDLSVDVDQNTSISNCLKEFSNMEMLCGECKYYCENCASKQEAEKRMRIKKLPKILALHLKRFKYVGVQNKFKKLTYRVVFPFELRLFNTTEDCTNSDRIYDLVSFVVHCGMGLNRGHYISVVKSHGYWFLFDDEQVEKIDVSNFEEFYGLTQDTNKKSETCYILFYESRENK